jgi:hypothetical protein
MYTIGGETEVCFGRTDRTRPSRGYPDWSRPQIPGKPVAGDVPLSVEILEAVVAH